MLQEPYPGWGVGENRGDHSPPCTLELLTLSKLAGTSHKALSWGPTRQEGTATCYTREGTHAHSSPQHPDHLGPSSPQLLPHGRVTEWRDALRVGFVWGHLWGFWDQWMAGWCRSTSIKVLVKFLPSDVLAAFSVSLCPPVPMRSPPSWGSQILQGGQEAEEGEKVTSQNPPRCTFGCWQLPPPREDVGMSRS